MFYLVDGDYVEEKNLIRQSFLVIDQGCNKATITAEDLMASFPIEGVIYQPIPEYLKEENLQHIKERSLVLVGVDNYITRRIIEDYTKELDNVAVIYGGNEYDDGDINILIRKNGEYTTPLLSEKHPEILTRDRFPDEIGCEEAQKSSPQIIPTNFAVANYMLGAIYALFEDTLDYHEVFFDIKRGAVRIVR
jgi:molybdopterin/thiamine biosynthesis adenylyltransferase